MQKAGLPRKTSASVIGQYTVAGASWLVPSSWTLPTTPTICRQSLGLPPICFPSAFDGFCQYSRARFSDTTATLDKAVLLYLFSTRDIREMTIGAISHDRPYCDQDYRMRTSATRLLRRLLGSVEMHHRVQWLCVTLFKWASKQAAHRMKLRIVSAAMQTHRACIGLMRQVEPPFTCRIFLQVRLSDLHAAISK